MAEFKIPFIDLKRQDESVALEIKAVIDAVVADGVFVGGEAVTAFEQEFAAYIGVKHCVSCGNGTDALELILKAMDIGVGDEVLVPATTWISDAEVVTSAGATPIFVDVLSGEYTIDPETVEEKITPRTKALIAVHLYGNPCRMDELMAVANQYDIKVIEDAAQAHGAKYKGQRVGSIGHAAAYSFYPTKNLGAYGDGGAITTHDTKLAEMLRLLINHGQAVRDYHQLPGRNSRLDTFQAAILRVKLCHLDQWNERRSKNARLYREQLKERVQLPILLQDASPVYHLFAINTSRRDALRQHLIDQGIATGIHYPTPLHLTPAYRSSGHHQGDFPVAEYNSQTTLSLPVFPGLTGKEIDIICDVINRYIVS